MKKWLVIAGIVFVALMAALAIRTHSPPGGTTHAVQLLLTGPDGQKFTGSYTADGKTNLISGVVPTTLTVRAKQLSYTFQPEDSRQEFRVVLAVENSNRTSRISYKGGPVEGSWRVWSYDFRMLRDTVLSGDIFTKRWSYWLGGESYR